MVSPLQIDRYNSEVFAFLPDFGYIIGGEDFRQFKTSVALPVFLHTF